jgi:hypothetical protein
LLSMWWKRAAPSRRYKMNSVSSANHCFLDIILTEAMKTCSASCESATQSRKSCRLTIQMQNPCQNERIMGSCICLISENFRSLTSKCDIGVLAKIW